MSKLKKKLLLSLLLVALLPTVLLGSYSLYSANKSLRESSILSLGSKTTLTSERIETFLENISSDIHYLRDSSSIRLYLSSLNTENERSKVLLRKNVEMSLNEFVDKKKIYQQARFIGIDGKEVVRINYDGIHAKTVSQNDLQNKKNSDYFNDAIKLAEGEILISTIDLNRENGEIEYPIRPTIRYATSVFDNKDELQGIMILNVSVEKIFNIITQQEGNNELMVLIDQEGYYYYHPDESKAWGSKHDLGTEANLFTEIPNVKTIISQPDKKNYAEMGDKIMSYQLIRVGRDQHPIGSLITLVPKDVIFAPLTSFILIFVGIALLAFLLTFALASMLSSSISSPLLKLKNEVKRLAKGDFDSPIDVETSDEVGDVSHEIEKLRRSMKILMNRNK